MITLEEAIIIGVNAPRPHQRVISKLNTELGILYYKQAEIYLEPFPEMMLDDDKTSPTPDFSLYDNVLDQYLKLWKQSEQAWCSRISKKYAP